MVDIIQYDLNTLLFLKSQNHFQPGVTQTPEQAGYSYLHSRNANHIIDNLTAQTALDNIAFFTEFNPNTSGWDVQKVEVKDTTGQITPY
ncbi:MULTISPECIES: hypothetical protein [Pectobacterium]|uniref:Uncharacterized protein n=1 Tax=Pectobacterium jejuense TaxID=2974022 RepID=A0ABW8GSD8_9GAMM|nr:hypothetical protein [Pectobacterium zantedeschiae]RYC42870.1 hypothetical protein DEH81_09960 [Pectobacterium zantedeschiae]